MDTSVATTTADAAVAVTPADTVVLLDPRSRAVLRAVAAGRGAVAGGHLLIDGLHCTDQFVVARLAAAGLVAVRGAGPASLTVAGRDLLEAA
jgi:hypothetical protein